MVASKTVRTLQKFMSPTLLALGAGPNSWESPGWAFIIHAYWCIFTGLIQLCFFCNPATSVKLFFTLNFKLSLDQGRFSWGVSCRITMHEQWWICYEIEYWWNINSINIDEISTARIMMKHQQHQYWWNINSFDIDELTAALSNTI